MPQDRQRPASLQLITSSRHLEHLRVPGLVLRGPNQAEPFNFTPAPPASLASGFFRKGTLQNNHAWQCQNAVPEKRIQQMLSPPFPKPTIDIAAALGSSPC